MKMQSNVGITIIALIVAIIVILILSMISISVLTGDNSIINKANEANVETRAANVEEEKNLWKTEQKVSKYSKNKTYTTLQELLDKLEKNKQITEDERKDIDTTGKVTIGERTITFVDVPINYDHVFDEDDAPKVYVLSLAEGWAQSSTMQKYEGSAGGKVNSSIFKSYDSGLADVIDKCTVGFNSYKNHMEYVGHDCAPNHTMLYSIEVTTDAKDFMISEIGSCRVAVDEKDGKGYQYINEEGYIDADIDKTYLNATGYNEENFRFIKVSFKDSKERNIKIELMGAFANVYADSQYYIKAIDREKPKTMMFVGDSWTTGYSGYQGKAVELPYRSYPTIIADNLGMTAINLGVAGTGYTVMTDSTGINYQERIRYSVENFGIKPDYIFICGGGNDVTDLKYHPDRKSLDDIVKTADSCYKYVKKALPNAKVIVLGVEYAIGGGRYEASAELKQLNELLKQKAKENKISYIDFVSGDVIDENGNTIVKGREAFVTDKNDLSDSIHLTYEGYKKMANKLTPIIAQLIE